MTQENIKLIGTYVFGIIILVFTGYMMVSGREIPEFWANLVALIAGALFLGNGVVKTIQRRRQNSRLAHRHKGDDNDDCNDSRQA